MYSRQERKKLKVLRCYFQICTNSMILSHRLLTIGQEQDMLFEAKYYVIVMSQVEINTN